MQVSSVSVAMVGPVPGGRGLFAVRPVLARGVVLELEGELRREPDRYSIQVDTDLHLHPRPEALAAGESAAVPWWFLNHSCDPTVRIDGNRVVAIRDLDAGDPLVFDYDATEWSLASPFRCGCGSCGGRMVRGYGHLDAEARDRRGTNAAAHLRRRAAHGNA